MLNIIHSIIILFTSLVLGCGVHEICRPTFDRNITLFLTFIPAFIFSVVNIGLEVTIVAIFVHMVLLSVFEK